MLQVEVPKVSLVPHSFNVYSTSRALILVAKYVGLRRVLCLRVDCIVVHCVGRLSMHCSSLCRSEEGKVEWMTVSYYFLLQRYIDYILCSLSCRH